MKGKITLGVETPIGRLDVTLSPEAVHRVDFKGVAPDVLWSVRGNVVIFQGDLEPEQIEQAPRIAPELRKPVNGAEYVHGGPLLGRAKNGMRDRMELVLVRAHELIDDRIALGEERALARILALCQAGASVEARAAQARFVSAYPQSPWVQRVLKGCNQ